MVIICVANVKVMYLAFKTSPN